MEKYLEYMNWCKMKCPKWPVARKCCFCVPIRKAVTIFGYFNLVVALLCIPMVVFLLVDYHTSEPDPDKKPLPLDPAIHLPLTLVFVFMDAILNVVMLIGAHRKNKVLLQLYFYFSVVFLPIILCLDIYFLNFDEYIENALYFFFVGLNIYLLFLVFNLIHLIEESSEVKYVAYAEPNNYSSQEKALPFI